ncbi:MAG: hypothetical protein ACRDK9_12965 [Solirubrobacterales bacterium]
MTEKTIACTLSAAEQAQRVASSNAVVVDNMLDVTASERGASMRFRPEAQDALHDLIAAESKCCAFLEFDLQPEGDALRLTVEGPEGARPIIDELFGLEGEREVAGV